MTLPLETQHKITDQYDAAVWNPTFSTGGNGARAYEANPDTSGASNQVMVLKAPDVSGGTKSEATLDYTLRTATDGVNLPTVDAGFYVGEARGYHKIAIATPTVGIPSGSGVQVVRLDGTSGVAFNIQVRNNGGSIVLGGFCDGHNGNAVFNTTEAVPYDEEFEVRWYWARSTGSDGEFILDIRRSSDSGSWVNALTVSDHTNTSTSKRLSTLRLRSSLAGTWANGTYDIEVAHIEFGVTQDADWSWIQDGYDDFKGCFPIDAQDDRVKFLIANLSPDRYSDGNYYRINYGPTPALGTATAWTLLKSWNPGGGDYMAQTIEATGLSASTRYYWRVELADSATPSAVTKTSDTFSFKTMQAAGSQSAKKLHVASCSGNDGKIHPLVGYNTLAGNITLTDLDYAVHTGDFFYEAGRSEDGTRYAPETTAEYLTYYKEAFEDRYRPALLHSTVFTPFPGDHAFWNNVDGATAATDNVNLIKNDATVGSNYDPTSTSTLQDVWNAATAVWDAWFGDHVYNNGAGYYYYRDHGNVRLVQLDGISFRDSSSNVFFGTTQIDWLKARCAEVAANTIIIISADTVWGPVNRQSDSVHEIAPDEPRGFNEWAETPGNVASGVKIVIVEGDTHRGWWVGKAFYDTNGDLIQNPQVLAYNALFSPIAQAHTVPTLATDSTELAAFDTSGYVSGDLIETSGGVIDIAGSSIRVRAWGEGGQSLNARYVLGDELLNRLKYGVGLGLGLGL